MSLDVSLLLDGQLPAGETAATLEKIGANGGLRDRYTIYGLVGDVLRGNSTPDDGFSVRIFEQVRRVDARMEQGYDPLAGIE